MLASAVLKMYKHSYKLAPHRLGLKVHLNQWVRCCQIIHLAPGEQGEQVGLVDPGSSYPLLGCEPMGPLLPSRATCTCRMLIICDL